VIPKAWSADTLDEIITYYVPEVWPAMMRPVAIITSFFNPTSL
jgi:hypothetical protein